MADLEADNETLRKKIESLERELLGRSPTKRPTRANAKDNGRTTLQLADPFGVDDLISAQKENREGIETLSKLELLRLGGAV